MTTNMPIGWPNVIIENKYLLDAFAKQELDPTTLRQDDKVKEAIATGDMSSSFLRGKFGMPFYCSYTAPTDDSSPIAFEKNFNPLMKQDSSYF